MTFETFNDDYVRRLTDGDSGAGEHFASYFGSVLFLKLRVRLRSIELIEDVRQETLTRVLVILREGEGVKRPERFGAFVNGVCENVVREFCRTDSRDESWDEHNIEEPIDPNVDLDASLINSDRQREIRLIFSALPEKRPPDLASHLPGRHGQGRCLPAVPSGCRLSTRAPIPGQGPVPQGVSRGERPACGQSRPSVTIACASAERPSPTGPTFSAVLNFTETQSTSSSSVAASWRRMGSR